MTDLSPETVERMVALVRSVAQYVPCAFSEVAEARAIVAELPDADLVEARRVIADAYGSPYCVGTKQVMHGEGPRRVHDIITGAGDRYWETKAVLAAIKRGRALAAGDRS